jgi:CheY-like chemotaxis protein
MSSDWTEDRGGVAFIDDDTSFTDVIDHWARDSHPDALVTSDPEELHQHLDSGRVATVVSDLRMPGIDVLGMMEDIRRRHESVRLVVLTGYRPNGEEEKRLHQVGAEIFMKGESLRELLDELGREDVKSPSIPLLDLQSRLSTMEEKNRNLEARLKTALLINGEWTASLIETLAKTPDPDHATIYHGGKAFTVSELINDLKNDTDRGLHFLRLWVSARRRFNKEGRG